MQLPKPVIVGGPFAAALIATLAALGQSQAQPSEERPRPSLREGSVTLASGFVEVIGRDFVLYRTRGLGSSRVRLLYTDDGGQRWRTGRWRGGPAHRFLFAADGRYGIALGGCARNIAHPEAEGPGGTEISSTRDGGASWQSHGCARGFLVDRAAVIGIASLFGERNGRWWRSNDGGRSRRLVLEDRAAELILDDDAITLESRGRRFIVRADGSLERARVR